MRLQRAGMLIRSAVRLIEANSGGVKGFVYVAARELQRLTHKSLGLKGGWGERPPGAR